MSAELGTHDGIRAASCDLRAAGDERVSQLLSCAISSFSLSIATMLLERRVDQIDTTGSIGIRERILYGD